MKSTNLISDELFITNFDKKIRALNQMFRAHLEKISDIKHDAAGKRRNCQRIQFLSTACQQLLGTTQKLIRSAEELHS